MILYHGTNIRFSNIDLSRSKDKRDFGKGFYTTTIFEQAEHWAKNQYIRVRLPMIIQCELLHFTFQVYTQQNKPWNN